MEGLHGRPPSRSHAHRVKAKYICPASPIISLFLHVPLVASSYWCRRYRIRACGQRGCSVTKNKDPLHVDGGGAMEVV